MCLHRWVKILATAIHSYILIRIYNNWKRIFFGVRVARLQKYNISKGVVSVSVVFFLVCFLELLCVQKSGIKFKEFRMYRITFALG